MDSWQLYGAFSLYRKAYDRLETAHSIAPDDVEVQGAWFRAWAPTLPRKERLAALERYLSEDHPDDENETRGLKEELEFLKATSDKPAHACKVISKVERTDTKLVFVFREDHKVQGVGLPVTLNDYQARMELDTGAGGLTISQKVAQKAGLVPISAEHIAGIGGKGERSGYVAVADHIQIGELKFQGCLVSVSSKDSVGDGDGLIGADVFGSYLVDIDFPGMQLKLSPLPKRPEDAVAPRALNSEGGEQADAEQQDQAATASSIDHQASSLPVQLPKDRYIAPEMADWTKVFRFHHKLLVPTLVNDSPAAVLFILDSGAFGNILSFACGAPAWQSALGSPDAGGRLGRRSEKGIFRSSNIAFRAPPPAGPGSDHLRSLLHKPRHWNGGIRFSRLCHAPHSGGEDRLPRWTCGLRV